MKTTAVLSSLFLLVWFVNYRIANAHGSPNSEVLPSSKIGQALDMGQTDWESKYPATPVAPNPRTDFYEVNMAGSKSARIIITGTYPVYNGISGLIERAPDAEQPTTSPTS